MMRSVSKVVNPVLLALLLSIVGAVSGLAQPASDAPAPDFKLTDTDGVEHTLSQYLEKEQVVVLEWFNPDCPFIVKHHKAHRTMNETYAKVKDKGVVWLAINSNAAGKQGAGLERNLKARVEYEMPFPVLMDSTGTVGRAYGAKTTPHMFVIGRDGKVLYEGAIDDNASPDQLGETNYVAAALAAALEGKPVAEAKTRPYGCSVKYGL